jgi:hypothetical protein
MVASTSLAERVAPHTVTAITVAARRTGRMDRPMAPIADQPAPTAGTT